MGKDATSAAAPGIKSSDVTVEDDDGDELTGTEASRYRALVATASYLAQDGSDIVFVVKELSRSMSAPTVGNTKELTGLSRYLLGKERAVVTFNYQSQITYVEVWVCRGM